jgi:catechol 2,3-dioxygenase-like lactoylglutathione lyase family enzyme
MRGKSMTIDLHHVHIFASDVEKTITWWCQHLDAKVLFDGDLAGARNVLIAVGTGRLNIYDQPPRDGGRGAVHHLGIRVAGLRGLWERLRASDISSQHGLREHDGWRYVMVSAPDGLLLELFEFDDRSAPANIDGRV